MTIEPSKQSQVKILIAEDEMIVAEDLSETIRDLGYEVAGIASTGEEAVRLAADAKPALVLLDINLAGDMDGIQASEKIRTDLDVPVIFLTAYDEKDVLCRAKRTEPYGYLPKPFSHNILKITIETALYKHAADQRVRESESLYRALVDATGTGYVILDEQSRVVEANSEYARLSGHESVQEIIGRSVVEWTADRDKGRNAKEVEECFRRGYVRNLEMNYQDAKGNITPIEINATVIYRDKGAQIVTLCRDITERKRADESSRRNQEQLQTIFETSPAGIIIVSPEGLITFANRKMGELFSCPCEDLLGTPYLDLVHPEQRSSGYGQMKALISGEIDHVDLERRYRDADGREFLGHLSGRRIIREDSTLEGLVGFITDITERKILEEAQKESEAKLRLVTETIEDVFWMTTPDMQEMSYVSPAYERIWGLSRQSLYEAPKSFMERVHPEDREQLLKVIDDHPGSPWTCEYRIVRPDGTIRWIHDRGYPVLDERGNLRLRTGIATDITDRKLSTEALARINEGWTRILESISDGFFSLDQEMRITYFNKAAEQLLGRKSEEVIGKFLFEAFPEAKGSIFDEKYSQALREKTPANFETYFGIEPYENWYEVRVYPFEDGISVYFQVTTERKKSEEGLREAEQQYRLLADNTLDVIWQTDLDMRFTYVNPAIFRMTGYTVDEWIGTRLTEHCDEENFMKMVQIASEEIAKGSKGSGAIFEAVMLKKNKEPFSVEIHGRVLLGESGLPIAFQGVSRDISERKRAEEALRESENRYRTLVETSPDPIIVYDLEGNLLSVNQQAAYAYGVESPEAVLAEVKGVLDILDHDSRKKAKETIQRTLVTGTSQKSEYNVIRKDGSTMPVEINSAMVKKADGKPVAFISAVRDISDRKKTEEALRASEDRYRQITENSLTGIFIHQDGVGVFANQRLADMLGYTKEEMIGRNLFDAVHPDDHETVRARIQARLNGELSPVPHQLRLVKKTGEVFWCDILATRIDYRGRPAVMGNLADITDRKKAEAALRDSERRYSTFLNSTTDLAFLKDEAFRYVMVNKANQAFFGKDEVEIIGRTDFELLTPSAAKACRRSDVEALASDRIIVTEEDVMGRIFETKKFSVDLENGQRGVGGLIREVTDRTKAEKALREREASLRAILNNAPFLMWLKDSEGRFLAVNDVFAKSCGQQSSEAVVGKTDLDVWPVDLAESYRADDREVMHQKRQKQVEEPVFDQGVTRWFETFKTPILDEAGNVIGTTGFAREITDRKLAEESLRNLLNFRQTLIDSIPNPVFYKDEKGNYIDCNEAFALLLGLSREKVVGKSVYEVVSKDLADLWRKKDQELFEDPHVQVFECTMVGPDGLERSLIFHKAPLFDADGTLSGLIGVILDITERRAAEEALRESEEKYRLVVEKAREAIFIVQDGLLRFVNPKTVELVSYTEEELLGKSLTDFLLPDDREMVMDRHMRRLHGEEFPTRYAFRIVDKGGAVKWVEIDSALISWGSRPAALIFMSDITERKRREESLRESEEWYRTLVEQSFDGVFVQKGSRIVFANSRLYEMLGYSEGELEGLDHWKVYHPDYQTITRDRAMARLRGEEVVSQYDVKLLRKDGTSFDAEISATKVEVRSEPGVRVWVRDTSRRKRSEEVQRRLATAIEQSAEAIVITDSQGDIQYVNPAYETITGYSRDEAIGQKPSLLRDEETDSPSKQSVMEAISRGERWSGHLVKKRKDGAMYEEDVTVTPVLDPRGAIVNYVVVKRDVTKEAGLQRQLLQAQKMEAIGTLAGGVAHDFNNILQVTLGYTELVLDDESLPGHCRADLRKVYDSARRGADLVQRLLMFSRKTEMKPRPLNLNRRIEELRKMLERTLPKMIDIQLLLGDGPAAINADPIQIDQILMNLAVNARDAMPDGGKLTVETANIILDEEYATTHLDTSPGRYVRLMITDTGSGMDRDTLEHIFEPFYTTKGVGEGTGLGLAMVHGIVKQHSGHIRCYSEPGNGTIFKIYFPALVSSLEPEEAAFTEMPRGGDETILLVDDEEMIRDLGSRILAKAGYKVITASDGEEALKKYQLRADEISLIVLDVIMPTMGGKQCLEALLSLNPSVKVVIASGFSSNGPVKDALSAGAQGFINKPYETRRVLEVVRQVLDEG